MPPLTVHGVHEYACPTVPVGGAVQFAVSADPAAAWLIVNEAVDDPLAVCGIEKFICVWRALPVFAGTVYEVVHCVDDPPVPVTVTQEAGAD